MALRPSASLDLFKTDRSSVLAHDKLTFLIKNDNVLFLRHLHTSCHPPRHPPPRECAELQRPIGLELYPSETPLTNLCSPFSRKTIPNSQNMSSLNSKYPKQSTRTFRQRTRLLLSHRVVSHKASTHPLSSTIIISNNMC